MALFALPKVRNVWLVLLRCNALSGVANIGDIVFRRVHCLRRFKGSLFGGRFRGLGAVKRLRPVGRAGRRKMPAFIRLTRSR